jgi:hypothetical protein
MERIGKRVTGFVRMLEETPIVWN